MIEFLFSQYKNYPTHEIILEIIAVIFGLLSVWFAKKNNILVFPTGIISTAIFVFLLFRWNLLGDMLINAYYVVMSLYGWYHWTRKKDTTDTFPISYATKKEHFISFVLFVFACVFVVIVYTYADKFNVWTAYVDTFTTATFFVAMWLMAQRKIENWMYWIVGDLVSIPLYFIKGYTFTSLQYLIFTFIAIAGYLEWKKTLMKS